MVTAPLYLLLAFQFTTSQKTAIDVLRTAKNAMIGAQSSAYLVNREYTDSSGNKYKGHTSIVIVKSPFEFRAVHSGNDGSRQFPTARLHRGSLMETKNNTHLVPMVH